jgi:hypothetical protein
MQDAVLGILLLKADISVLKWLDFLPPVLEKYGLFNSWMALLYALGYEDQLRAEDVIPESESPEAVKEFFQRWLNQPAKKDIPSQPQIFLGTEVTLHSYVLGSHIIVEASNNLTSIYLAEAVLGSLEAFLATSFDSETVPYRSELRIKITPADLISGMPEYRDDELSGEEHVVIRHPSSISRKNEKGRTAFSKWLKALTIDLVLKFTLVTDINAFEERLLKNEAGIGRAMLFADVQTSTENLLGRSPKFSLSDWKSETDKRTFPYKRNLPWNYDLADDTKEEAAELVQFGEDDAPDDLFDIDKLRHQDRKVISLINMPLWDKAQWQATAYIYEPGYLPLLAICFADAEAARRILKELQRKLGDIDKDEQLRISIIKSIDRKNPTYYKLVVSPNPNLVINTDQTQFILVSRIHTMTPLRLDNLNNFLQVYEKVGKYVLVPAYIAPGASEPEPVGDYGLEKKELIVRDAWQIGINDPDMIAISEDSDPIIPDGVENRPVLRALQRFSKRIKRRRH